MTSEALRFSIAVLAAVMLGFAVPVGAHAIRTGRRSGLDFSLVILGLAGLGGSGVVFNLNHPHAPVTTATWIAGVSMAVGTVGLGRMLWHLHQDRQ